jgi:hypothetical protein
VTLVLQVVKNIRHKQGIQSVSCQLQNHMGMDCMLLEQVVLVIEMILLEMERWKTAVLLMIQVHQLQVM